MTEPETPNLPVVLSRAIERDAHVNANDIIARPKGVVREERDGRMVAVQGWSILPREECERVIGRIQARLAPVGPDRGAQLARWTAGAYPQNLPPDPDSYVRALAAAFTTLPEGVATPTMRLLIQHLKWRPAVADVIEVGERLAAPIRQALADAQRHYRDAYEPDAQVTALPDIEQERRLELAEMAKVAAAKLRSMPGPQTHVHPPAPREEGWRGFRDGERLPMGLREAAE